MKRQSRNGLYDLVGYTKDAIMAHLEMRDYTLELSLRKIQEKHGRDMQ